MRIHAHERNLIAYVLADDQAVVLHMLGGEQDWVAILTAADF